MKTALVLLIFIAFPSIGNCAETHDVLVALSRISDSKIPREKLRCEINGTSDIHADNPTYKDVTVADVFADYASWSLSNSSYKSQSFKCEGKETKKCSWQYGEKENPKNPGWQIFLNFAYDSKSGQVDPKSLECVQVP